jgi:hypothetical protein
MWSPEDDGYGSHRTVPFGDVIAAVTIEDLAIVTKAL